MYHYVLGTVRNVECLTLNASIATIVVCFSRLLKCLRSLYGSVDPDQTAPILKEQSVLGPHFLLTYLNSPVMLGMIICSRRLQQMTFSDAFFLALKGLIGD